MITLKKDIKIIIEDADLETLLIICELAKIMIENIGQKVWPVIKDEKIDDVKRFYSFIEEKLKDI